MQILKVYENPGLSVTGTGFEVFVDFSINEVNTDALIGPKAAKVCKWVSYTFTHNFVIIEHATRIIAGGAIDAKTCWDENWNDDSVYIRTDKYQLRGKSEDITMFLLQYGNGTL